MIATTEPRIVDFWEKRGIKATPKYTFRGITRWVLEIPENHEDLEHPEYIELRNQEISTLPITLRMMLKPPICAAKNDEHFILVEESDGYGPAIYLTQSRELLKFELIDCETREYPSIVSIKNLETLTQVLEEAQKNGAEYVKYLIDSGIMEVIDIEIALHCVKEPMH